MATSVPTPSPYPTNPGYGAAAPQYPYVQPQTMSNPYQQAPQQFSQHHPQIPHQQQYAPQPEVAYRNPPTVNQNLQAGAPNLQELLANLRQAPNPPSAISPQAPMQAPNGSPTDLAGLLSNVARQQNPGYGYSQSPAHQSPVNPYPSRPPFQAYPNPSGTQAYGNGQQAGQQNVQNIMDQLARWNK